MHELSDDAQRSLEGLAAIQTRGGGERQTHTDRAIRSRTGLNAERTRAALEELASHGYVVKNQSMWDGPASLATFRLHDKGRRAVDAFDREG